MKHKKHWYKIIIDTCPVCGRHQEMRERQYTPAPPKHDPTRYDYGILYCTCYI